MTSLEGRTVLVTGAAGGLGRQLTLTLVAAGARVVATDIKPDADATLKSFVIAGGVASDRISYWTMDQADVEGRSCQIAKIVAAEPNIDSLVNNAAIYPIAETSEVPPEDYARVMTVNAECAFAWVQALLPRMKAAGFGRIVSVGSITFDLGFTHLAAYVASKGALIGLTRVWARELGPYGVTVNTVSPGAFQTDAELIHPDPAAYNQRVLDAQCLKRRGTPVDFANLVRFLLGNESSFITSQNIRVDGGWVCG